MEKNKIANKIRRTSSSTIALISAILITLGVFFLLYNFINDKKIKAFDYMNNLISDEKPKEVYDVNTVEIQNIENDQDNYKTYSNVEKYIGYLEIPKIGFKRGFYNIESNLNNVDSNIQVIKGSTFPNEEKNNLIIAGHSGTGYKAFFKDLYKLQLDDELKITYDGINYKYKITDIYLVPNTGKVAIKRDENKKTLTLITCTKDDSTTQTVYIAQLY